MECPICKESSFIEMESYEPFGLWYGWSVKECMDCGYKVQDKTLDGRFAGVMRVITKPIMKESKPVIK